MTDRTYFRFARSWHADEPGFHNIAMCNRTPPVGAPRLQFADRVPADGHLCGSCARVIAARTDIEDVGKNPTFRHDDVPEPVASEQDDWAPV